MGDYHEFQLRGVLIYSRGGLFADFQTRIKLLVYRWTDSFHSTKLFFFYFTTRSLGYWKALRRSLKNAVYIA